MGQRLISVNIKIIEKIIENYFKNCNIIEYYLINRYKNYFIGLYFFLKKCNIIEKTVILANFKLLHHSTAPRLCQS